MGIQIQALKDTHLLRGMAGTLRMRTTIKDQTSVHGCHHRGDIVVRMSKVLATPRSCYSCFNA